MGRREFLDTLRTQLQGVLSPSEIEGHLHYYQEYIAESIASGKTEQEVMEELGNPIMIARTLIDSAQAEERREEWTYGSFGNQEFFGGFDSRASENDYGEEEKGSFKRKIHTFHISPFAAKWVIPLVVILIVFLLLTLLGTVVAFAARFFVPILAVILVIAIVKSRN